MRESLGARRGQRIAGTCSPAGDDAVLDEEIPLITGLFTGGFDHAVGAMVEGELLEQWGVVAAGDRDGELVLEEGAPSEESVDQVLQPLFGTVKIRGAVPFDGGAVIGGDPTAPQAGLFGRWCVGVDGIGVVPAPGSALVGFVDEIGAVAVMGMVGAVEFLEVEGLCCVQWRGDRDGTVECGGVTQEGLLREMKCPAASRLRGS